MEAGVQQKLITESLVYIFLNHLFLYPTEIYTESNFTGNNSLYSTGDATDKVKKALSNNFRIIENMIW